MKRANQRVTKELLPLLPLRGLLVFPYTVVTIDVGRDRSIAALQKAAQGEDQRLFVVAQRDSMVDHPDAKDLYMTGTIVVVKQVMHMPDQTVRVLLEGRQRALLMNVLEAKEIYVSKSSACKKGGRSHVLEAMGLPARSIDGAIRIGLSRFTTQEDIDALCLGLKDARNTLAHT